MMRALLIVIFLVVLTLGACGKEAPKEAPTIAPQGELTIPTLDLSTELALDVEGPGEFDLSLLVAGGEQVDLAVPLPGDLEVDTSIDLSALVESYFR